MARNLGVLVRQVLGNGDKPCAGLLLHHLKPPWHSIQTLKALKTLTSIPTAPSSPPTAPSTRKPLYDFLHSTDLQSLQHRALTSPSGPSDIQIKKKRKKGPSNIVTVKTMTGYGRAISNITNNKAPVVFFFTIASSDACKIVSPILKDLSEQFPHVITYKFDVVQGKTDFAVIMYGWRAMPTFSFFQNGVCVSRIIGADVAGLKSTFEKLYGPEGSEKVDKEVSKCKKKGRGVVAEGGKVGVAVKSSQQSD
ncbi:thioredoxin O1, mitochondrial isoform X1 [Pyrus x bretschneideri]|uniref:thioredoxin O1, mitochondrial isoform X1 n=1 Tax=Pyrus x bretschneideri TaxID=225117 RepID=UPI000511912B|nr:thioredoxin O1, mitochondrial isoform X1 [Pyrus x bretschneideri]